MLAARVTSKMLMALRRLVARRGDCTRRGLAALVAVAAWLGDWTAPSRLVSAAAAETAERHTTVAARAGRLLPGPEPDAGLEPVETPPENEAWLALPDLRTLPPHDLRIERLPDGSRELRLSNTIWNSGAGALELEGEPNSSSQTTRVVQQVHTRNGTKVDHLVGEFVWHPTHDHWHFEDFSLYELWRLSPGGRLEEVVSSSDKVSYCVIDTDVIDEEHEGFTPQRQYFGCGRRLQGLSAGWGDTYKSHLDGQSIQMAGLVDGVYALKSTTNPDRILVESNYENNAALLFLEIRGTAVEPIDPLVFMGRVCLGNNPEGTTCLS